MKVIDTKFPEVKLLEMEKATDARGHHEVMLDEKMLKECGIGFKCVQQTLYDMNKKGTFFGIHFQDNKHPQAKIIYCVSGKGIDYIVDLKKDSPTYKKWISFLLKGADQYHIYIPQGYGHAFLALEDNTKQLFSIDEYFYKESAKSIYYGDRTIGLELPIPITRISEQDKHAPCVDELENI